MTNDHRLLKPCSFFYFLYWNEKEKTGWKTNNQTATKLAQNTNRLLIQAAAAVV